MSRLTVELVAEARKEYVEGFVESAIYHLLLALVAATDPDVNVADEVRRAFARARVEQHR